MASYNLGHTPDGHPVAIAARFAARHGLIVGATGTGKSYTIARLAEQMTAAGVPVCLLDVKGDLSGLARSIPCQFYAPEGGAAGGPFSIRADDLGPDAMARALQLSDAQAGALDILYAWASDRRRRMGSLAEVQAACLALERDRRVASARYGHISPASLGVIRRALLRLERAPCQPLGGTSFDVAALLCPGVATILDARRLYEAPALYGAAVLYLLDSLWRRLPEIGDTGAPRLALVIDEAHLLFAELPPALISRVERIVRLIRSRGVALYFASQSPADIPGPILAQLGNRIQHGLRGATPADLRAIRAAADTMPVNPAVDAGAEIVRLGVGQALVSVIGANGVPMPVEIAQIAAPRAKLSPVDGIERVPFILAAPSAESASDGELRRSERPHPGFLIIRLGFAALALAWTAICGVEAADSGDWSGYFILWIGMPLFLLLRGRL